MKNKAKELLKLYVQPLFDKVHGEVMEILAEDRAMMVDMLNHKVETYFPEECMDPAIVIIIAIVRVIAIVIYDHYHYCYYYCCSLINLVLDLIRQFEEECKKLNVKGYINPEKTQLLEKAYTTRFGKATGMLVVDMLNFEKFDLSSPPLTSINRTRQRRGRGGAQCTVNHSNHRSNLI
jgi:hypothetical protein